MHPRSAHRLARALAAALVGASLAPAAALADDGSVPLGELVETSPGVFVGTTSLGGREDQGTVFQIDAKGDVTLLHTFTYFGGEHRRYVDGRAPDSTLTPVAGHVLLGGTQSGGDADDVGTVFKLRAD